MDINEIKKYLEENKDKSEVKEFLDSINKKLLESESVKAMITQASEKALNDYKAGEGSKLQDEKVKQLKEEYLKEFKRTYKIEESKDPAMIAMQEKLANIEKENKEFAAKAKRESIKSAIIPKMKGFEEIADFFIGEDIEKTTETVQKFSTSLESYVKEKVETALKSGEYTPPSGGGENANKKEEWTPEKVQNASDDEIREFIKQQRGE